MEAEVAKTTIGVVKTTVGYIALAVPATVAVTNVARVLMEWLNQKHKIKNAFIEQAHNITTHYLDKALDPNVPLVMRQQLLRFLATPDKGGLRLQNWAKGELARVGNIVDEANKAVEAAEADLLTAQTAAQVKNAEKRLREATLRQRSIMDAPAKAPITAAALRAGLIYDEDLSGLDMQDSDLKKMRLIYKKLHGANFSRSDLSEATLQGSDLRASVFIDTNMTNTTLYKADLRGANLQRATLKGSDLSEARLEGADLHEAKIKDADCRATYDTTTRWPDGFDPVEAGAVKVDTKPTGDGDNTP